MMQPAAKKAAHDGNHLVPHREFNTYTDSIIDLEVAVYRRLVVITFLLILVILDLDCYVRVF